MTLIFRKLNKNESFKLKEIDRSDYVEGTYCVKDGKLVLENRIFNHEGFHGKLLEEKIKGLNVQLDNGGELYGTFDGLRLVGIAGIHSGFRGSNKDTLEFGPLWISKEYRRCGIGRKLVKMAKDKAKEMGAKKLYISGTPSKNTTDFYFNIGCTLASEIDEELFQEEPYDIHLEIVL